VEGVRRASARLPTVEAIERMGKKLEAQTNGRISIQMYPQMQLGGEKEMIEQAQVGALQIARISVGAMGPVVDELNVFNMPFVFRDEAHMRKVIDGPIGSELLDKVTRTRARADRARLDGRGHAQRLLEQAGDQARRPEGHEVRMMGNPIFVETMNAMGGTASRWASTSSTARCRPASSTAPRTTRRRCSRRTTTR
jgi:TRAP-type C4-dicarboxylate transport system substrate-binding protein